MSSDNTISKEISDIKQLPELAAWFLSHFKSYKVFTFNADLGAGKTTFIKEVCFQLGVEDNLSSPSYGIVNQYKSNKHGDVFHLDCYRLNSESESWDIGLHEVIDSGNYCFIEWPEQTENLLPNNYVSVGIQTIGQTRIFNFTKL